MGKCLYCYKKLREGDRDFHPACSQKIFGTKVPPILPYVRNQLADLAEQVIRSQTTLTGVRAKLSLDIHKERTGTFYNRRSLGTIHTETTN